MSGGNGEMNTAGDRYDTIGQGYTRTRREDPRDCRGSCPLSATRTVVNVGAVPARYEPDDRHVIAVEPSDVMAAQRPRSRVPAIRAFADDLPLRDGAVDAAMAVLTLHHWDDACNRGVREKCRVARGRVVIVTYDLCVSGAMWLLAEYLPEVATLDHKIFPTPERLAEWLGGRVAVEPLPIHRDSPDWMLGLLLGAPRAGARPEARAATSGFARMPAPVVDRVVAAIAARLADGSWDRRHAHPPLEEYDAGLRLIVGMP